MTSHFSQKKETKHDIKSSSCRNKSQVQRIGNNQTSDTDSHKRLKYNAGKSSDTCTSNKVINSYSSRPSTHQEDQKAIRYTQPTLSSSKKVSTEKIRRVVPSSSAPALSKTASLSQRLRPFSKVKSGSGGSGPVRQSTSCSAELNRNTLQCKGKLSNSENKSQSGSPQKSSLRFFPKFSLGKKDKKQKEVKERRDNTHSNQALDSHESEEPVAKTFSYTQEVNNSASAASISPNFSQLHINSPSSLPLTPEDLRTAQDSCEDLLDEDHSFEFVETAPLEGFVERCQLRTCFDPVQILPLLASDHFPDDENGDEMKLMKQAKVTSMKAGGDAARMGRAPQEDAPPGHRKDSVQEWINSIEGDELLSEESSAAREVTSGPEMHPVNNVPSGNGVDDDLSLGAEAKMLNGEVVSNRLHEEKENENAQKKHTTAHRRLSWQRAGWYKQSFGSDSSNVTNKSAISSVDLLLQERRADPEEILMGLGFGAQEDRQQLQSRIPHRFLSVPSKAEGITLEQFFERNPDLKEYIELKKTSQSTPVTRGQDGSSGNGNKQKQGLYNIAVRLGIMTKFLKKLRPTQDETDNDPVYHELHPSYIGKTRLGRRYSSILHPTNQEHLAGQGLYDMGRVSLGADMSETEAANEVPQDMPPLDLSSLFGKKNKDTKKTGSGWGLLRNASQKKLHSDNIVEIPAEDEKSDGSNETVVKADVNMKASSNVQNDSPLLKSDQSYENVKRKDVPSVYSPAAKFMKIEKESSKSENIDSDPADEDDVFIYDSSAPSYDSFHKSLNFLESKPEKPDNDNRRLTSRVDRSKDEGVTPPDKSTPRDWVDNVFDVNVLTPRSLSGDLLFIARSSDLTTNLDLKGQMLSNVTQEEMDTTTYQVSSQICDNIPADTELIVPGTGPGDVSVANDNAEESTSKLLASQVSKSAISATNVGLGGSSEGNTCHDDKCLTRTPVSTLCYDTTPLPVDQCVIGSNSALNTDANLSVEIDDQKSQIESKDCGIEYSKDHRPGAEVLSISNRRESRNSSDLVLYECAQTLVELSGVQGNLKDSMEVQSGCDLPQVMETSQDHDEDVFATNFDSLSDYLYSSSRSSSRRSSLELPEFKGYRRYSFHDSPVDTPSKHMAKRRLSLQAKRYKINVTNRYPPTVPETTNTNKTISDTSDADLSKPASSSLWLENNENNVNVPVNIHVCNSDLSELNDMSPNGRTLAEQYNITESDKRKVSDDDVVMESSKLNHSNGDNSLSEMTDVVKSANFTSNNSTESVLEKSDSDQNSQNNSLLSNSEYDQKSRNGLDPTKTSQKVNLLESQRSLESKIICKKNEDVNGNMSHMEDLVTKHNPNTTSTISKTVYSDIHDFTDVNVDPLMKNIVDHSVKRTSFGEKTTHSGKIDTDSISCKLDHGEVIPVIECPIHEVESNDQNELNTCQTEPDSRANMPSNETNKSHINFENKSVMTVPDILKRTESFSGQKTDIEVKDSNDLGIVQERSRSKQDGSTVTSPTANRDVQESFEMEEVASEDLVHDDMHPPPSLSKEVEKRKAAGLVRTESAQSDSSGFADVDMSILSPVQVALCEGSTSESESSTGSSSVTVVSSIVAGQPSTDLAETQPPSSKLNLTLDQTDSSNTQQKKQCLSDQIGITNSAKCDPQNSQSVEPLTIKSGDLQDSVDLQKSDLDFSHKNEQDLHNKDLNITSSAIRNCDRLSVASRRIKSDSFQKLQSVSSLDSTIPEENDQILSHPSSKYSELINCLNKIDSSVENESQQYLLNHIRTSDAVNGLDSSEGTSVEEAIIPYSSDRADTGDSANMGVQYSVSDKSQSLPVKISVEYPSRWRGEEKQTEITTKYMYINNDSKIDGDMFHPDLVDQSMKHLPSHYSKNNNDYDIFSDKQFSSSTPMNDYENDYDKKRQSSFISVNVTPSGGHVLKDDNQVKGQKKRNVGEHEVMGQVENSVREHELLSSLLKQPLSATASSEPSTVVSVIGWANLTQRQLVLEEIKLLQQCLQKYRCEFLSLEAATTLRYQLHDADMSKHDRDEADMLIMIRSEIQNEITEMERLLSRRLRQTISGNISGQPLPSLSSMKILNQMIDVMKEQVYQHNVQQATSASHPLIMTQQSMSSFHAWTPDGTSSPAESVSVHDSLHELRRQMTEEQSRTKQELEESISEMKKSILSELRNTPSLEAELLKEQMKAKDREIEALKLQLQNKERKT